MCKGITHCCWIRERWKVCFWVRPFEGPSPPQFSVHSQIPATNQNVSITHSQTIYRILDASLLFWYHPSAFCVKYTHKNIVHWTKFVIWWTGRLLGNWFAIVLYGLFSLRNDRHFHLLFHCRALSTYLCNYSRELRGAIYRQ